MPKPIYLYLMRDAARTTLKIGVTENIRRRTATHAGASETKKLGMILIAYKKYTSKQLALNVEKSFTERGPSGSRLEWIKYKPETIIKFITPKHTAFKDSGFAKEELPTTINRDPDQVKKLKLFIEKVGRRPAEGRLVRAGLSMSFVQKIMSPAGYQSKIQSVYWRLIENAMSGEL